MRGKHLMRSGKIDGDFFFCVVLIIVACFLLSISSTPLKVDETSLGPFFWPKVILVGMLICGVIKLVFHLRKRKAMSEDNHASVPTNYKALIFAVVLTFGYFLGIVLIGYPIASLIFVIALSYLGGIRSSKLLASISVGLTLITSILFVGVMYISLPRGEWIFYPITNWFFSLIKF
jgi:putative tricarboxylic transport membrane protein